MISNSKRYAGDIDETGFTTPIVPYTAKTDVTAQALVAQAIVGKPTNGNDQIFGDGLANTIDGGNGDDVIQGLGGDDTLFGGAGNDYLSGDAGNDRLFGGGGSNTLIVGLGRDYAEGGGGYSLNRLDFRAATHGVTLNIGNANYNKSYHVYSGTIVIDAVNSVVFKNITEFAGSSFDDRMIGSKYMDYFYGGGGNDSISGLGGNDLLYGESGDDTIWGDSGDDIISGAYGNDVIFGGEGNDSLSGNDGDDRIDGGAGRDVIFGGTGNNLLQGGDGDDEIHISSFGNNIVEGGRGKDELHFDLAYGIQLDLRDATVVLVSDGVYTTYPEYSGTVSTRNGLDTANYSGIRLFFGTDKSDVIIGGRGDDVLIGRGGDDIIDPGTGKYEQLDGRDGTDILSFGSSNSGVEVFFANNSGTLQIGNQTIRYYNFEGVEGSNFADNLVGSANNDILRGLGGNDRIDGQRGNDKIFGGEGNNSVYGGDGDDVLICENGNDRLYGDNGSDTLSGGAGLNTYFGGFGRDTFVMSTLRSQNDIMDFEVGRSGDKLYLGDVLIEAVGSRSIDNIYQSIRLLDKGNYIYALQIQMDQLHADKINTSASGQKVIAGWNDIAVLHDIVSPLTLNNLLNDGQIVI